MGNQLEWVVSVGKVSDLVRFGVNNSLCKPLSLCLRQCQHPLKCAIVDEVCMYVGITSCLFPSAGQSLDYTISACVSFSSLGAVIRQTVFQSIALAIV